jgi:hypothetical protein
VQRATGKRAIGLPPYRHVIMRRVKRAKQLMQAGMVLPWRRSPPAPNSRTRASSASTSSASSASRRAVPDARKKRLKVASPAKKRQSDHLTILHEQRVCAGVETGGRKPVDAERALDTRLGF